ncbi:MAG: response regulator transcription factor [Acidobacteria bacterium]|nr:response regulator transcription factor [Acidobacteriota bacterium]
MRIVLVDDHRVVARSLKAFLESFDGLQVVGMAASGEELLEKLDEWQPEIIVQDLLLPGGIDGVETTRRVLRRQPGARVIVLTASTDEARMMGALRAGACGYVRKDAEPETLLAAVRAVARGKQFYDVPPVAGAEEDLTPREKEVLRRVALGRSNKEIADELGVADETVKTHVTHVLSKLMADNRAQAVVQALKRGLVSLDELE